MSPKSLSDLPVELLVYRLLLLLSARDLLAFGTTDRYYAILCNDEILWKMKCEADFGLSEHKLAMTKGWKFVYRTLKNARVFIWGGISARGVPKSTLEPGSANMSKGIPNPAEVAFPKNSAIVDLIAGETSFHALDLHGRVYAWGILNIYAPFDLHTRMGRCFANPEKEAPAPMRLELTERICSMSSGSTRALALDSKNQIWVFLSWGMPFRFIAKALNCSSPSSTPVQVECGGKYDAALTASGDVYVWSLFIEPTRTEIEEAKIEAFLEGGQRFTIETLGNTILCKPWAFHHTPRRLPPIPKLPELSGPCEDREETKLVKVAGMHGALVGLTNKGHVLKYDLPEFRSGAELGQWQYLPNFSKAEKIREDYFLVRAWKRNSLSIPGRIQVLDIGAHRDQFVAFTGENASITLFGSPATNPDSIPGVKIKYLGKGITSVFLGSYHNVALSSDGKLYTQGSYFLDQLGMGYWQPPTVLFPKEVMFDHCFEKDWFCFAATASGSQAGALVVG